jgi:hypothetical protein
MSLVAVAVGLIVVADAKGWSGEEEEEEEEEEERVFRGPVKDCLLYSTSCIIVVIVVLLLALLVLVGDPVWLVAPVAEDKVEDGKPSTPAGVTDLMIAFDDSPRAPEEKAACEAACPRPRKVIGWPLSMPNPYDPVVVDLPPLALEFEEADADADADAEAEAKKASKVEARVEPPSSPPPSFDDAPVVDETARSCEARVLVVFLPPG